MAFAPLALLLLLHCCASIAPAQVPNEPYEALHNFMQVERERLERECRLTDRQAGQLAVAARGAIESVIEAYLAHQVGPVEDQPGPPNLLKSPDNIHCLIDLTAPSRHSIWVHAVKSSLTDDQRALDQQDLFRRANFLARVEAHNFVLAVDVALRLSDEQREEILRWSLDNRAGSATTFSDQKVQYITLTQAHQKEIQGFLTAVQQKKWRELQLRFGVSDIRVRIQ